MIQYTVRWKPEIMWAVGIFTVAMALQFLQTPDADILADPMTWGKAAILGSLRTTIGALLGKSKEQPENQVVVPNVATPGPVDFDEPYHRGYDGAPHPGHERADCAACKQTAAEVLADTSPQA